MVYLILLLIVKKWVELSKVVSLGSLKIPADKFVYLHINMGFHVMC